MQTQEIREAFDKWLHTLNCYNLIEDDELNEFDMLLDQYIGASEEI